MKLYQSFFLRHLPLVFTAAVVCLFLLGVWLIPIRASDSNAPWVTEFIRQYHQVDSVNQRQGYIAALVAISIFCFLAFIFVKRGKPQVSAQLIAPHVGAGAGIVLSLLIFAVWRKFLPQLLRLDFELLALAFLLLAFAAPRLSVRTTTAVVAASTGAYVTILILPGFLVDPIPLMENDPTALTIFEMHILLLTMPGHAVALGQNFFGQLPFNYGLLMPSIMSVIDHHFHNLSIGNQLRFVQVCQGLFVVAGVAAYICYRPQRYLGVLTAIVLAGPYMATAGLGIWFPNQTGLRSLAFPVGILALLLVDRLPTRFQAWWLGTVAGIAVLANFETAVALAVGYLVYVLLRKGKLKVIELAQMAGAGIAAFVLYLLLYRLSLGRLPFSAEGLNLFAWIERFTSTGYGLRLFSAGVENENYYIVPFALMMFAHAVYVLIKDFAALGDGPLSPRQASRGAIASILLVWLIYYFNSPNWWQIWTHLFLYGFLVIDLMDRRLFGIGFPRIAPGLLGRWRQFRISVPRLAFLFLLGLMVTDTNTRLARYTNGFAFPAWTRTSHRAVLVSDVLVPGQLGDALLAKAQELSELNNAVNGNLVYLTANVAFMPAITGLLEPEPIRNLWVGIEGDRKFEGVMNSILQRRYELILIDAPTGLLAISGERATFQDRVRRAVQRDYTLSTTDENWQIWRLSKPTGPDATGKSS